MWPKLIFNTLNWFNGSFSEDGLKENVLYVSAGPREDCKTEGTEYASVTKRSASDNDDTNVYADVKKDGKKSKKEAAIYSDVKPKKGNLKQQNICITIFLILK